MTVKISYFEQKHPPHKVSDMYYCNHSLALKIHNCTMGSIPKVNSKHYTQTFTFHITGHKTLLFSLFIYLQSCINCCCECWDKKQTQPISCYCPRICPPHWDAVRGEVLTAGNKVAWTGPTALFKNQIWFWQRLWVLITAVWHPFAYCPDVPLPQ